MSYFPLSKMYIYFRLTNSTLLQAARARTQYVKDYTSTYALVYMFTRNKATCCYANLLYIITYFVIRQGNILNVNRFHQCNELLTTIDYTGFLTHSSPL